MTMSARRKGIVKYAFEKLIIDIAPKYTLDSMLAGTKDYANKCYTLKLKALFLNPNVQKVKE